MKKLSRVSAAHALTLSVTVLTVAGATTLLVGCDKAEKPATQVVAKVNTEEISVHQVNFLLARQGPVKPEQADAVSRKLLERLIDQELAVQKAEELGIPRQPEVLQQIEAARREIIARVYASRVAQDVLPPTAAEVRQYYDSMPALFKQRRIYQLREFRIEEPEDRWAGAVASLRAAKSASEFADSLRDAGLRFEMSTVVRSAEQVPLGLLDELSGLPEGQGLQLPSSGSMRAVFVQDSRSKPMDEAAARQSIEQFLTNEQRRNRVQADTRALRAGAKIEYVGKFADLPTAASAPTQATSATLDPSASAND